MQHTVLSVAGLKDKDASHDWTRRYASGNALAQIWRPFFRALCPALLLFLWIYVTGFLFSMFSGLVGKKGLFRPFVFNMFSGLGLFASAGH
jgi:hypothetical protein